MLKREKGSMRCLAFVAFILVTAAMAIGSAGVAWTQEGAKKKVESIDDLPRNTYPVTSKPSVIIASADEFAWLSGQLKADIQEILDTYEIDDAKTLQGYYNTLQSIAFVDGDYDAYKQYVEKARALEQKQAQKLTMGTVGYSHIDALAVSRDTSSPEFRAAFRNNLAARVEAMPWDVVHNVIQQFNGQVQILTESLLIGIAQSQIDPAVESSGFLSTDQATQLVNFRTAMVLVVPYGEDISQVFGDVIASHEVDQKDIWPARNVTLTGEEGYSDVVVAIWDSGVDVDVFEQQLFVNEGETINGADDDGNGYVDDVNGIGYDLAHNKSSELLYSLGDKAAERTEMEDQIKGFMDNGASLNTKEAEALRRNMSELEPTAVQPFLEDLNLYAFHSHGTHVAGIAIEGNPYARVLTARLTFDHRMIPEPFTVESATAFAKESKETVQYFKDNGVRTVNMSWGLSLKDIEQSLAVNGIGESAAERGTMAREMLDIVKKGLNEAIASAPEITFIAAAGNSDNDVQFDEFVPQAFDLDNLLIVAAVDQAGQATGFTSFGRTIQVFANGFEVESYVPGGRKLALSGTSMASPSVTNLAGKLLAVDPSLTPDEVIDLIVDGSDDFGKDGKPMRVINPQKSLDLLKQKMASKTSG